MTVEAVAQILKEAQRVLFITGAGISVDSGLPTYRGVGGLYEDDEVEDGLRIEQLVSKSGFDENPARTWRYLAKVESAGRNAKPNVAHTVIAELESDDREVWVLTQNVDGLHQRAGSSNVIDIHGDYRKLRCTIETCDYRNEVEDYTGLEMPPSCPTCGQMVRPSVVFFEEALPVDRVETMLDQIDRGFDIVFSIGTSSLFPYIVTPVFAAQETGVPTVEVNPAHTTVSPVVTYQFKLGAAEAMQQIAAVL